jgi:hypothetical protein
MDPVAIISAALAAGASAGTRDLASAALQDAYSALKERIRRLVRDGSAADRLFIEVEANPEKADILANQILRGEADLTGDDVYQMALHVIDLAGAPSPSYNIVVSSNQGVMISGNNLQVNTFSSPDDSRG